MKQHRISQGIVKILSMMGLETDAVVRALENRDMELAKEIANKPTDNEELSKKLWLLIATNRLKDSKNIQDFLKILDESNHMIKIDVKFLLAAVPVLMLILPVR